MVDYTWLAWELKVCWTYQQAYRLALQHVATLSDEVDMFDLHKVEHFANHFNFRMGDGKTVNLKTRQFPKDRTRLTEKSRALLSKARRLRDLALQISSGTGSRGSDKQILHLRKKLHIDERLSVHHICDLAKQCEQQAKEWSRIETAHRLTQWKSNMRKDYALRAKWLTRPFKPNPGVVKADGTITGTKNEAAHTLLHHWKQLGDEVAWQQDDLQQTADEISTILRPFINDADQDGGRAPNIFDMKNALTMIKGTHGVDGWTRQDLRIIAAVPGMADALWAEFSSWLDMGRTPTIIQQSKISCIGKIKEDCTKGCAASNFRPITIQSCFWRVWSCMWLNAPCINNWKNKVFPKGMAGASRGAAGPEVLAATADALLGEFKHGISLDFTHAFDCVSSRLLGHVLDKALPQRCRRWARLLTFQWGNLTRWFHYSGHCHKEGLTGDYGIPQGDPASPLMLLLLLLAGQWQVSQQVPGVVWQCIYMDDRMAITQDRRNSVLAARAWQAYARKIHLKENLLKTQYIDVTKASQSEGINFSKACEHLGTCIGQPSEKDFRGCKKNSQRVSKAKDIATRVALLPCGTQSKLEDCKVFGLSRMAYGWIRRFPFDNWCKALDKRILHTLGQFNYGIFELKQILIHAHLGAQANITFRLVRLWALRNHLLENIGFGGIQGDMEHIITERLTGLGWYRHRGRWKHHEFPQGFTLDSLCDQNTWKQVQHFLRQSWRAFYWNRLPDSPRHEFAGGCIPVFNTDRMEQVKRFSKVDGLSLKLSIGAIQSPYVRSLGDNGKDSHCPFCGGLNVFWEHLWICGMGREPPEDILLRRFGWPVDKDGFLLSLQFLAVVKRFADSYNKIDEEHGNAGHSL